MSDTREMSMAGNSRMFASRTPGRRAREEKRRVLDRVRETPHESRKFYHFIMGAMCFTLYGLVLSEKAAMWLLAGVGGLFIAIDLLRLRWSWLQTTMLRLVGNLMRREELHGLTANSWYVLGMLGSGLLFPKAYALCGLAFLAVGDPVAAIVGTRWGRVPLRSGKSIEGSVANFVVSAIAAFAISRFLLQMPPADALLVAVLGGATSAVAEAAPWPVNDNLAIPITSAALLWLVLNIVGVPLPVAP